MSKVRGHVFCIADGCKLRATFGETVREYCNAHKKPGMENLTTKKCAEEGCKKQASHSNTGETAKWCGEHKKEGMENVVSQRCAEEGCKKLSKSYYTPGTAGRYCAEHKKDGMILTPQRKCATEGCTRSPVYKKEGETAKYCGKHRTSDMKNVVSKRCEENGCNTFASFDVTGKYGRFCSAHKKEGMINIRHIVEKKCISCNLEMKVNREGHCVYCRPDTFKVARFAKQTALMEYLDARELFGSNTDKAVDGGVCGKERPDRVYDYGDKVVILECDENQHKQRDTSCEVTRMINIGQMFGGTPVYFIRWNPDRYVTRDTPIETVGMRHKRVGDLISSIREGIVPIPKALVSAHYMYYDDWCHKTELKWQVITPYDI